MFINQGAQSVVVIAVWLDGLEVYDAYDIARHLSMDRPEQHLGEFLLQGTIWADSYRILAMFYGNLPLEDVALSTQGWIFEASLPGGFTRYTQTAIIDTRTPRDVTKDLEDEIYSFTGTRGGVKLDCLLRSICGI